MLRSMTATVFVLGFMFASTEARSADPYQALSVLPIRQKPAPDFSLPQVNGKTVGFSDYQGKVVLLGFFKTF